MKWKSLAYICFNKHTECSVWCIYNEDPTAVENIKISSSSAHKIVRDDQLLIIRDGKTYNIMGVEITK